MIYYSTNFRVKQFVRDGTGWIQYDVGLMNIQTPILIRVNNYLFAGTYSNGIYRLDISGSTDINEKKAAGNFEVKFEGSKLSSEVYYYQLRSGTVVETK